MKKTIYTLLMALLIMVSCAAMKSTVETRTDTQRQTYAAELAAIQAARLWERDFTLQVNGDEILVRRIYEYDTTQGVDTIRGKPPLKREILEERHRNQQAQASDLMRGQTDTIAIRSLDIHNKEDTSEDVTTTEKRGSGWITKSLAAVGVAALLLLMWWILITLKPNILTLWAKIKRIL